MWTPPFVRKGSNKSQVRSVLKRHWPEPFDKSRCGGESSSTMSECTVIDATQYVRGARRSEGMTAWDQIFASFQKVYDALATRAAALPANSTGRRHCVFLALDNYRAPVHLKFVERQKRSGGAAEAASLVLPDDPMTGGLPAAWDAAMDSHDDELKARVMKHAFEQWLLPWVALHDDCRLFYSAADCSGDGVIRVYEVIECVLTGRNDVVPVPALYHSLAEADQQIFHFVHSGGQALGGERFRSAAVYSVDTDVLCDGLWFLRARAEPGTALEWRSSVWLEENQRTHWCQIDDLARRIANAPALSACARPVETLVAALTSAGGDYNNGFFGINHEAVADCLLNAGEHADHAAAVFGALALGTHLSYVSYERLALYLYGRCRSKKRAPFESLENACKDTALGKSKTGCHFGEQRHRQWLRCQYQHFYVALSVYRSLGDSSLSALPKDLRQWGYSELKTASGSQMARSFGGSL